MAKDYRHEAPDFGHWSRETLAARCADLHNDLCNSSDQREKTKRVYFAALRVAIQLGKELGVPPREVLRRIYGDASDASHPE